MSNLVPRDDDDAARDYLDLAAILSSAIPILGGAVSNVLGGWSQSRRFQRIRGVLEQLATSLAHVRESICEEYVRSDEFEDLLDQTLRRVAAERHEAKRRLYAAFLAGAVTSPGEPYHEQLRMLRTLEELQPDHLRIVRAMTLKEPITEPGVGGISPKGATTILETLRRRLAGVRIDRLEELVEQLTVELHVTEIDRRQLKTIMSAHGARDLQSRFTRYGHRVIAYIRAAESTGQEGS